MDNAMHELVYPYAKRALHVEMWESELPRFTKKLHDKGRVIPTYFVRVERTILKTRRPTEGEDASYNGWKRMHATKYQSMVLSIERPGSRDPSVGVSSL